MQPAIGTVAKTFPNIHFAIVDGACTDDKFADLKLANCQDLFFKEQESGALVGAMAALLEKGGKAPKNTHVISAVGGISIPPVNHYIAGYKWAAKMFDPSIKVLVGYSNDFNDPAKCKSIANSQIGQKSEFVFQVAGGCGLGALQAAGQAKVYSFGVDADQKDADKSVIASALKKVDVAVYDAIKAVVDNQFKAGESRFSLQNDATRRHQDAGGQAGRRHQVRSAGSARGHPQPQPAVDRNRGRALPRPHPPSWRPRKEGIGRHR